MSALFSPMKRDVGTGTNSAVAGGIWESFPSSLAAVRPCEAVVSASSWSYALVGQCFSRMRRVQFDEEHQRSLLSCHSTDESARSDSYSFPDDAMLELRRRVMKDDATIRKPTFARDLAYEYPLESHSPPQQQYTLPGSHKPTSRWEKRKANALALKLQAEQERKSSRAEAAADSNSADASKAALSARLTATERALDDILLFSSDSATDSEPSRSPPSPPLADDVRRLSVDELLAPRGASRSSSTLSTCSSGSSSGGMSPEKTSVVGTTEFSSNFDATVATQQLAADARELRAWLSAMDPPRASEYCAYATSFEAQGFAALRDVAELGVHEVEQAMSEIGVAKFAHRTRMRKAIVRLCEHGADVSTNSSSDSAVAIRADTQVA